MTEFIGGPSAASNLREYPHPEQEAPSVLAAPTAETGSVLSDEDVREARNKFGVMWADYESVTADIVARFTNDAGEMAVAPAVEVETDAAYL